MAKNKQSAKSPTLQLNPDRSRPTADFNDPVMCAQAYKIDHVGMNAYLVALAAWQRGLKVTFHYQFHTGPARFARLPVQGWRGELFSVSDGRKTHGFRRTQGDLTRRDVSAVVNDKAQTRQVLMLHGIEVPDGLVVSRDDTAGVAEFVARHPGRVFILKPLDGTLGQGVQRRVPADEVLQRLAASDGKPLLLEEFVEGVVHRVNVVGNRYVAAYALEVASVTGDGRHTVTQLMELKNAACRHRPLYPTQRLQLREREQAFLQARGLTPESVLPAGEWVQLNDIPLGNEGADMVDATDRLPMEAREMAVRAALALDIPVTGLDIIVHPSGRVVVLEANQNPLIHGNVFPRNSASPGNRLAEAIIDFYFPGSVGNRRLTQANFDFMAVCQALQGGSVGEVSLPLLGPQWTHRRLRVPARVQGQETALPLRSLMWRLGVHGQGYAVDEQTLLLDLLAPEAVMQRFVEALKERPDAAPDERTEQP